MNIKLAIFFLCAASPLLFGSARTSAGETNKGLFVVRQWDELVTTGGDVYIGKVNEQDDGSFSVRDMKRNLVQRVPKNQIKDVRRKSTPEAELERLSKEYGTNPEMMLRVAKEATTRFSLHEKVIPILERLTAGRPDEALRQMLASLYLATGKPDRALRIAEELVKAKPGSARNLMLRGQGLSGMDKLDEAEKDLSQAFKLAPTDDEVGLAYANLLLRTGRSDDAKKMYAEAITANPRSAAALAGLGHVQIRTGDFSAAEQTFNQALALNGDFRDAKIGLATAKLMLKQYDDAYSEANLTLNIDPNSAEAYEVQAFCKLFKGDPASLVDVEQKVRDSLQLKANQPRLNLALAISQERLAKYEELKPDKERDAGTVARLRQAFETKLNEVMSSDAPDGFIQYFIGERRFREAEEAKRRKEPTTFKASLSRAGEAFQRAARIEPGYAPVHAAYGATLLGLAKYEEARTEFASAAKIDSKSAEYLAGQGLALLNSQKFDQAGDFFNQALALDGNNVAARCGRGYIANWQRDKPRAMDNFQKALAADGDCSYAAAALQAIYKQDGSEMEYVRFNSTDWPQGWKARAPGAIKLAPAGGQAVFSGQQGFAQGSMLELYRDFSNAGSFERLEADLTIPPSSPVEFGLRVSSGSGPAPAFEIQFGKDASSEIKVKFRDSGGAMPSWASTHAEWPKNGRVRLSIDTDGIKVGETVFHLSVNGRPVAEINPKFTAKLGRLTLGVFMQVPPKESVSASVNNIAVVKRGVADEKNEVAPDVKIIEDKTEKPPAAEKKGGEAKP